MTTALELSDSESNESDDLPEKERCLTSHSDSSRDSSEEELEVDVSNNIIFELPVTLL